MTLHSSLERLLFLSWGVNLRPVTDTPSMAQPGDMELGVRLPSGSQALFTMTIGVLILVGSVVSRSEPIKHT